MGNRDALLLGAKRCLLEKGYAGTTARDIAAAAGVSLAAIGYHFSSKEALLTEALLLAFGEWDQEFRAALNATVPPNIGPVERFELIWARLIETFETHRSLWVANFELFSQMDRQPEIRRMLGNNLQLARSGLAALFADEEESSISEHTAQTIGTFHHVLLTGMIAQWLIDPDHALSARELTDALLRVAAGMQPGKGASKPKRTVKARLPRKSKKRGRP
jgi:AcrR family transcriptional regulator